MSPAETHWEMALASATPAKPRGHALREHARERDAVGRHPEPDDEHKVEDDIEHARGGKEDERRFRVADGIQNAVAVVIERGGGHAKEVNAKVQLRAVDQIVARVQKLEQRAGKDKAQRQHQKARDQADKKRRVNGLAHVFLAARAEMRGDKHVDAAAKAAAEAAEAPKAE